MLKRCWPLLIVLLLALTGCAGTVNATVAIPSVNSSVAKNGLTFIHFFSDECPNCLVMIPIVDQLATRYSNKLTFETLNVETDGKDLFHSLGLNGQPVFVIMKADGSVVYKGFGRVPEHALDSAIQKAIGA